MKKLTAILICSIVVLASCCLSYADGLYQIDAQTGQIITAPEGALESVDFVRFSVNWGYNKSSKMYEYTGDADSGTQFYCSVYNGMYTTSAVELSADPSVQLKVYRNGDELEFEGEGRFANDGAYIVRDKNNTQVLSFTILSKLTNAVNSYSIPSIFFVDSVFINEEQQAIEGNTISMSDDGLYDINYFNYDAGAKYTLTVNVDHSAPELEIIGLNEEGYARNAVSFGETEAYSTLLIKKDGVEYDPLDGVLTEAGDYSIEYTDEAGNMSLYDFTIRQYLDLKAWFVVVMVTLIIIGIIVFAVYSRKHMRVR